MSRAQVNRSENYSIGEAARTSGLTAKAIRYYEQIGLIPKARRRNSEATPHTGGDRIYNGEDIGRLSFIRYARLVDLGLADIRELLKIADAAGCPSEHPAYADLLRRHIRSVDARINHLAGLRSMVHKLLTRNRDTSSERCTWHTCDYMQPAAKTVEPAVTSSSPRGQND